MNIEEKNNPLLKTVNEVVIEPLIAIEATIRMKSQCARDKFITKSIKYQKSIRKEKGCLTYCFAADPVKNDLVQVYELWENKTVLDAHFEYPNYKKMLKLLKNTKSSVSRKLRIDKTAPVYGPDSNPTASFD